MGGHARCSVLLLLPSDAVHVMNEVVAGSPFNFLDQARNIFVVDGGGESTHKLLTPSCQLPVAVMRLLPPLIVVSALLGGCSTTGSIPSTASPEPGADEAADPASALILAADPATPLLVTLRFPSKPLIVLLDHAERGVGRCVGRCMSGCRGVALSSRPPRRSTEKEPEKTEITNNEERRRKKIRYFLGGIQCTRYLFVGNEYRRYLLGDIQGRRYLFDGIMCWRYGFG